MTLIFPFQEVWSLEDGAATLTEFTASIIGEIFIKIFIEKNISIERILICGGGRK